MPGSNRLMLNFLQRVIPNWPKIVGYVGSGQNGMVYKMDNGRLLKFVYGNASVEVNALKRLANSGISPKLWNSKIVNVNANTSKQFRNEAFPKKNIQNKISLILMNNVKIYSDRINPRGNVMTLGSYIRNYANSNRVNIGNRVLKLMNVMHGLGVYHRNLHTDNVLVAVDDKGKLTGVWIIDFGRSRTFPRGNKKNNTPNGRIGNVGNVGATKKYTRWLQNA